MRSLCVVADDLTGALDASAQFTGDWGPVRCELQLSGAMASDAPALAVNADVRDAAENSAVAAARATLPLLLDARLPFKKIDSLLRGHWAAELAAVLHAGRFARAVFCPAFPAHRRFTRGGRQHAPDAGGRLAPLPVDIGSELERRGLRVRPGSQGPGADVALFDAESDDDLAAVVGLASSWPGRSLWCGSAGLAGALSRAPPVRIAIRGRPRLALIGTLHPRSRRQIEHLRSRNAGCVVEVSDIGNAAERIARAMAECGACLADFTRCHTLPQMGADEAIRRQLNDLLPVIPAPLWAVASGGATASMVLSALGTDYVVVDGEVASGVPASRLFGGSWGGGRIVTKSGAFGDKTALARLIGLR